MSATTETEARLVAPRDRGSLAVSPLRYVLDAYRYRRRPTRVVAVGDVGIGGVHPIRVQSMTTTDTMDTAATVTQTVRLVRAGCEIVRITAPTVEDARNLGEIRRALRRQGIAVPLVADIHFSPAAALEAADHVEKVRINPGNFADSKRFAVREYSDTQYLAELSRIEERFAPLVEKCRARGVAMRIGTNHGSLSDRIMNRFGDTPLGMVESALEFAGICARYGYHDVVFSMKASNPKVMIQAYRLLAVRLDELGLDYPFHLGVTEAGNGEDGRIKSAIGIGSLLEDGIGDTIRVSLTEDPEYEVPVAFALARPYQPPHVPPHVSRSGPQDAAQSIQAEGSAPHGGAPADRQPAPPPPFPPSNEVLPDEVLPDEVLPDRRSPYEYNRRPAATLALGLSALGGGQPVRVVHPLEGNLATVSGAIERALALATADGLVRPRPDAVSLTVHSEADAGALHALRRALDEAQADLPLVVRVPFGAASLPAIVRDADMVSIDVAGGPTTAHDTPSNSGSGPTPAGREPTNVSETGGVADALAVIARARRPLLLEVTPHGPDTARAANNAVTLLLTAASQASAAGCLDIALAVSTHQTDLALRTYRLLATRLSERGTPYPLHLIASPADEVLLQSAVLLGALLCDGIGDSIQVIGAPTPALAFNILQGAGVRLSKTEFVACPSCGRTLFDLQETTERIQAQTGHLKGVKIAIMGCIVNGPGEMADADFGYVGGAPGKVNLYVGKECIEKGVPAEVASDRLIDLIQRHGKWVDPPPPPDDPPSGTHAAPHEGLASVG
ncbi:MAG: (E)-4-hydroxy-3-methylbut-2-enyl-diphosphate synthase [Chloroflexota bacterium]|nr:(E)-4-hydroxy-3-methylbut-2-enyl-diphosphate synthase [Chloroflexota bacterium]